MKNILFLIAVTFCTYSCKEDVAPVVETSMNISVMSKQNGADLLSPYNAKRFDIGEIRISYPPSTQKYGIVLNAQDGQAHLFSGSDGKYYIKFYPSANHTKEADIPKVSITWPDKTVDIIEPYIIKSKGFHYISEIYLNNTLAWNFDSDKNNITNRPTRSISVIK